jgi:hypothetical protein
MGKRSTASSTLVVSHEPSPLIGVLTQTMATAAGWRHAGRMSSGEPFHDEVDGFAAQARHATDWSDRLDGPDAYTKRRPKPPAAWQQLQADFEAILSHLAGISRVARSCTYPAGHHRDPHRASRRHRHRRRNREALAAISLSTLIAAIICVVGAARFSSALDDVGPNLTSSQLIVYPVVSVSVVRGGAGSAEVPGSRR